TTVAFSQQVGSGDDVSLPGAYGPLALVGANAFVVFFALSWGPIMWLMLAEMFPNRMRAMALAIGTATNWIFNFIVTFAFEPMTEKVGLSWLYGVFAVFALVSLVFVRRVVPETKRMELEDMTGESHQAAGPLGTRWPPPAHRWGCSGVCCSVGPFSGRSQVPGRSHRAGRSTSGRVRSRCSRIRSGVASGGISRRSRCGCPRRPRGGWQGRVR